MKNYFILLSICFLFLTKSNSYCQDTNSAKYFPLKVGNSWTYYQTDMFYPPFYKKAVITKDSIINGLKYFYISGMYYNWIRYDSAKSNLLIYTPNNGCSGYQNDRILDSLASSVNNIVHCLGTNTCTAINNQNVFTINTQVKYFTFDGLTYGQTRYAKNIGIIYSCSGEPPPCSGSSDLKGCVINGIIYGDTTLTDINQISNDIPEKYFLSQNYPNPFNPKTIINYNLPISNFVSLKVYNVLGNEIETLVSERQNAGSYSVTFDAASIPSGIYFYKLVTDGFTETKKMLVVK